MGALLEHLPTIGISLVFVIGLLVEKSRVAVLRYLVSLVPNC